MDYFESLNLIKSESRLEIKNVITSAFPEETDLLNRNSLENKFWSDVSTRHIIFEIRAILI